MKADSPVVRCWNFGTELIRDAVTRFTRRLRRLDTIQLLVLGYLSYVLVGWGLLCLPLSHERAGASSLDHLFTSTSAVSTTGLTTISASDSYSLFGEIVIALLIQFGGLGYMTISSFVMLAVAGDLSPMRRRVSQATLSLPQGFELKRFLGVICIFTFLIEAIGALALYPSFAAHHAPHPIWQSIFHSVSAFCTAGFGLFNNSLEDYRDDVWMNVVVTTLSYLGAIGFIVLHDLWLSVRQRKPHVTLTTKVILWSTLWITIIGTVLFAIDEPTVQTLTPSMRWLSSLFQVMSASTTVGFNTVSISGLSMSSLFLLTIVMLVGASPSGTGGGLKTTTVSALWAEMMSVLRRQEQTTFLGRTIPEPRMRAATASVVFYLLTLAVGIYGLALVESAPLPDQIFECASALGTVGLSRGITAQLSFSGKWIIIGLMFIGRVGPVILGMAFFQVQEDQVAAPLEDVAT